MVIRYLLLTQISLLMIFKSETLLSKLVTAFSPPKGAKEIALDNKEFVNEGEKCTSENPFW